MLSKQLGEDYEQCDRSIYGEGSSLKPDALTWYFDTYGHLFGPYFRWCTNGRLSLEQVTDKYIVSVNVKVMTAADFLEEAGVMPEQVAMIFIDAEGMDQDIADNFLDIPGFK